MLIIKKLTKQCAPCPSASIMILQKGIAISLEGWHLVLTLLASKSNSEKKCLNFKNCLNSKNPIFGPLSSFWGQNVFLPKIQLHHAEFQKKLMSQSQENFRTEGRKYKRTEGWTDR